MKDPAFLSFPVYPPIVPTKHSLSTTGDDHLIPLFSKNLSLSNRNSPLYICIQLNTLSNSMIKFIICSHLLYRNVVYKLLFFLFLLLCLLDSLRQEQLRITRTSHTMATLLLKTQLLRLQMPIA